MEYIKIGVAGIRNADGEVVENVPLYIEKNNSLNSEMQTVCPLNYAMLSQRLEQMFKRNYKEKA